MKKITIRDIAREAGVSVATVSNVLNGVAKCREDTREKVLQVVKELGYRPNISAKTLATRRSGLIGLVINQEEESQSISQGNLVIKGMNDALRGYENYDLIVTEIYRDGKADFIYDWIQKRDLEGLILVGNYTEEILKRIEKLSLPMVLIDNYNEEIPGASYIHSEDTLGSYLAIEHLIERGYRNIAFAGGDLETDEVYRRRFFGYKAALEEYGLKLLEENIYQGSTGFKGGYDTASDIVTAEMDAVFFANPESAFGALKYFNKKGCNIPEGLGVIAFGEARVWEYTVPALSSVDLHMERKGSSAIDMILDKINNTGVYKREISIPVEVRERETT